MFKQVINETDLVSLIHPGYDAGYRASLAAIEEAKKTLDDTGRRSYMFNRVNIVNEWRNPLNWTFLVYGEKFSHDWLHFCQENKIGRVTDDGILLPESLAFIFMTYLAKEIAFEESASIITDNTSFDNFTSHSRTKTPQYERKSKFAKGIVNLLVPKNLAEIPLNKIVKFRTSNRNLITAFNYELENMQQRISDGYTERDFINSYNNVYSEFSNEVLLQGLGIASIPFAAYLLISNPVVSSAEYTKEILGALGMVLGGGFVLSKALRDARTGRYCRKYMTNLERLK